MKTIYSYLLSTVCLIAAISIMTGFYLNNLLIIVLGTGCFMGSLMVGYLIDSQTAQKGKEKSNG